MVSQTNAAGTSARPRRRSTPTLRKQARARKANRYPELDYVLSSNSACHHWNADAYSGSH
ncbi:unnamed protein product [Brassica napus]|uniref:(rape) hypothetical protein n=1 Tax=Brassica napus TaxID=3708 RepID=A0A816IBP1_BRANA|nr:unnamed protein product [Brassica napus]